MTQDAHSKIVRKTGSSKNMKQHAIGCEYIHIKVNDGQLTVLYSVGIRKVLHDQFISAHHRKPPLSNKAFVRTVREIKHDDVVSSGISVDELHDKHPQEWTNLALITL